MDMLGFLPGQLEQRAHPVIVAGKLRPGVIHVRQNESSTSPKHGEIFMPPDLVERTPLFGRQKRQLFYLSQRLRRERLAEIQTLLPPG
jgi:hypothetical protein